MEKSRIFLNWWTSVVSLKHHYATQFSTGVDERYSSEGEEWTAVMRWPEIFNRSKSTQRIMINKIAVLRANALGDFIFILPALQALRQSFPAAEIVLLGKELHRKLLQGRPSPVDRVEVIPPCSGVGMPEDYTNDDHELSTFFQRMREENFDVAVQMHGGGRYSNRFLNQLGAKLTVGSRTADADALDINVPYTTYSNEVLRFLELVSLIGAKPAGLEPELKVLESDIGEAQMVLQNHQQRPLAIIQPGASDPRRWWPAPKFAQVADALIEQGFYICINGSQSEADLISELIGAMHNAEHVQDLSGIPLNALIGTLAQATVMISNDTGPLHLAYAVKTPAVGIYWAPNIVTAGPAALRYAKPLVAWNTSCPLCGAPFQETNTNAGCDHNTSFVAEISVDEVLSAVKELTLADFKIPMEII